MRLEVHSEAREEFLQAVSFYEAQVPGLGSRFVTEIERCQNALLEISLIGHPYGRRLRKFTVGDKFPYSIAGSVGGFVAAAKCAAALVYAAITWSVFPRNRSSRGRSTSSLGSTGMRELKLRSVVTVVVGLTLGGVVAEASGADHPNIEPGQDISNPLFTMKSPYSAGWVGLSQNAGRIAFARSGASAAESDVAAVILFQVPVGDGAEDFVTLVKKGLEKDTPSPRFEVQHASLELSQDRPYSCAKYSATSIDHGNGGLLAPKKPLHFQLLSLYCRYPGKPNLGFAISFSHRGTTTMTTFQQEAEAYIAGVQVAQMAK
jgi:hypothetical protein